MHTLVRHLVYRGHNIKKGRYGGTVASIDGVEIQFSLREATKRVSATTSWGELHSTYPQVNLSLRLANTHAKKNGVTERQNMSLKKILKS